MKIRVVVISQGYALAELPNRDEPLRLYSLENRIQDVINALVSPSPSLSETWEYSLEGYPLDVEEDTVITDPRALQRGIL